MLLLTAGLFRCDPEPGLVEPETKSMNASRSLSAASCLSMCLTGRRWALGRDLSIWKRPRNGLKTTASAGISSPDRRYLQPTSSFRRAWSHDEDRSTPGRDHGRSVAAHVLDPCRGL